MKCDCKIADYVCNLRAALATSYRRLVNGSDSSKWKNLSNHSQGWDDPTRLLAQMIEPKTKVSEFGARRMTLLKYLSVGCQYTPSDL